MLNQTYGTSGSTSEAVQMAQRMLLREQAYPTVVITQGFVVLVDRYEDGTERERYDIAINDLGTAERVAFWMRQLASKNWVTKRHLEKLANAVVQIHEARRLEAAARG